MSQQQRSPSYGQVLDKVREVTMRQIKVAFPCSVQAYDPLTQTVDLLPLIDPQVEQEDGTFVALPLPVLPHVPVAFPAAGGFRITFPLKIGDTGQVIVSDLSMDLWQQQGGHVSPKDQRSHHHADAVFYPGLHPDNASWTGAGGNGMTIGPDNGPQIVLRQNQVELGGNDGTPPTDAVALASLVLTQLQAIKTAFDAHLHPVTTAPGTTGQPTTPMGSPTSPASAILKAK